MSTETIDETRVEAGGELPSVGDDATEHNIPFPGEQPGGENKLEGVSSAEPGPPPISDEDREHLYELYDALAECQGREDDAAETHKSCKKATEVAQEDLNRFVAELRSPRRQPSLFDTKPSEDSNAPLPDPKTEEWRKVALAELGLSDGVVEKLHGHVPRIDTLGNLADFLAGEDARLTDVKGIGQQTAEKISDALERYFEQHPEASREPAALAEASGGAPDPDIQQGEDFWNETDAKQSE